MNDYSEEKRVRGQTLLIVEGKHEKNELFGILFRCFPSICISMDDIWIYGTNIYMLYEDIVKEYGEAWEKDDIDLPFVISRKLEFHPLRYKEDFVNIMLVFDYERHDKNFSEEKILKMQRYFNDAADAGKLYINYPMIEAYQHLSTVPDDQYAERKIPVSLQPGKEYKALVRRETGIASLFEFPGKMKDLLCGHFGIEDEQKGKQCCARILNICRKENLEENIEQILNDAVEERNIQTAKYQIRAMVAGIGYAHAEQTYWQYMREIFKQIIRHNICKANRIQNNQYVIDDDQYRERFWQLDPVRILEIQNICSRGEAEGFIWILCTCIFFVAEYNFRLVI